MPFCSPTLMGLDKELCPYTQIREFGEDFGSLSDWIIDREELSIFGGQSWREGMLERSQKNVLSLGKRPVKRWSRPLSWPNFSQAPLSLLNKSSTSAYKDCRLSRSDFVLSLPSPSHWETWTNTTRVSKSPRPHSLQWTQSSLGCLP